MGDQRIKRKIKVRTNDPLHKRIVLTITGLVEKFADISPGHLRLSGTAGTQFEKTIRIIPRGKYPFKILGIATKNKGNIRCRLETYTNKETLGYRIIVANINLKKGRYEDRIKIKTTSEIRPEIEIAVSGRIREAKKKMKK